MSLDTNQVQQSKSVYDFRVDYGVVPTAETNGTGIGDTLKYRAIFVAKNGRGRDTLFVIGTQQYPVSMAITLPVKVGGKTLEGATKVFDLRGRRVEKILEGTKVPWAPLVSPKE